MAKDALSPIITLSQCRSAYFIHSGQVYPVLSAPSDVFKAAIQAVMDIKGLKGAEILQEVQEVLVGQDDEFSRWWLLCHCALRSTRKPMQLFASREEAESAVRVAVAAGDG